MSHPSGTGWARRRKLRLVVRCGCGARFPVPPALAGRLVRCTDCEAISRVPRGPKMTEDVRRTVLEALGIDAEVARQASAGDASRRLLERAIWDRRGAGRYACTGCGTTIKNDRLAAAYCAGALLCDPCQVASAAETWITVVQSAEAETDAESWEEEDVPGHGSKLGLFLWLAALGLVGLGLLARGLPLND